MFGSLKGGPLMAVAVVVLAVIGGATALAWNGTLSGSDWLVVITPILAAATGVTTAHVVGNTVASAALSPPPGTPTSPTASPTPGGGAIPPDQPVTVIPPAIPTGVT